MDSLPPWSVVRSVLGFVVLPGCAAGAALMAVLAAGRPTASRLRVAGALALAGGVTAGNFARDLFPWWSLEPGWPSLFPATLASICGGSAISLLALRWGARWAQVPRWLLAAGCACWLTSSGPGWSRLGCFLLIAAGGALDGGAVRPLQHNFNLSVLLSVLWGMAAATVLIFAHSARFCEMAVLMTAALAGVSGVAMVRKLDGAAIGIGANLFIPALMLSGAANTYSEVPLASFVGIALVPGLLWCLQLPAMQRWSNRSLAVATAVAVLLPSAVAVMLAMRAESLELGG